MPNNFIESIESIISRYPTIYRYFRFSDRDLKSLYEPYLWFSTPDQFNDAFEGHEILSMSQDFIHYALHLEECMFPPDPPTPERIALEEEYRLDPTGTYEKYFQKYRSRFITETTGARSKGCCCFLSGLNQGLLTDHQEMTMWGHYAAGMRGFRVMYDTKTLLASIDDADAYPIAYKEEPRRVDVAEWLYRCTSQMNWPRIRAASEERMIQVKHTSWAFEGELRLRISEPGARKYDPNAIKRVDFGAKMPRPDRELIRHVLDRHQTPIDYYSADLSDSAFSVTYRQIP